MQLKTIKRVLTNKMTDWLETITDESLKQKLRSNILISGGSITSMLLGEPVNDFDVYIKDMNVLLSLAEYYTKESGVEVLDGRLKEHYLQKLAIEHGKPVEELVGIESVILRNLKFDQVKLDFGKTNAGLKMNENASEDDLKNYIPVFFSPNAISLSNKVQIVLRFHGDNQKIHETFDFIHATNYFTFDEGLVTNKEALECILTKQLRYQGSLYPLTTIIRVKKFVKRNWNINAGELLKIMFQISELDLKNPDVLEEQLIGVDIAYFSALITALRGVDPNKMTSAYLNSIIDRVFNEFEEQD